MLVIQLTASYLTFVGAMYFKARWEGSVYFICSLYSLDVVFYIMIYVKFKLAYYDEFGFLVTDPARIAARYINLKTTKIGFWYDLVAVLPIDVFGLLAPESYRIWVISNLHMNRAIAIIYVLRWFWNENSKLNINVFLIRLGLIIIWNTVALQIIAWLFGLFLCLETNTCEEYTNISSLERFKAYVHELWIILCMFIGSVITPEELMPNSVLLIIYCIFVMMFTRLMVAFTIGHACAIVQSSYHVMMRYTGMVTALCKFYSMNDLCTPLRVQLWSYLEQLWRMKGGQQVPQLLYEAPYYLREAIKSMLYGDYVKRNVIFAECHEDFMRQLVTCLKQYIFFPGNYITFAGDVDDNMYFVYSGEVEFLIPGEMGEDEAVQGVLLEGDAFGMTQGIYPGREHAYNYRARTVVLLLILNRPDWESMLVSFPAVNKEIFNKAAGFELSSS